MTDLLQNTVSLAAQLVARIRSVVVVAKVLAGHVYMPGSDLVLVVVLSQVLLQSLWDWKLAYAPIGL